MEILAVGAASHAYPVVLGHRPYGLGETSAGHKHTCHEGGGHGATTYKHNSQLAIGWEDIGFSHTTQLSYTAEQP